MSAYFPLEAMPLSLPIFPLDGALLLPDGDLPLNIFEPRYIAMTKAALAGDRLIGMIQPCPCPEKIAEGPRPFYSVGCAGRISSFEETSDGRFLINLHGISRFELQSHHMVQDGYRQGIVTFARYERDFREPEELPHHLLRPSLIDKLQKYLDKEGLFVDWDMARNIPDHRFYTLLAMVCPFSPAEKQALLEAESAVQRCNMLKCLLDIASADDSCQAGGEMIC